MTFASVLDAYCSSLHCTNAVIAAHCGISASSLSRYRSGSRLPANNSSTIYDLANGIAQLSKRREADAELSHTEIAVALDAARRGLRIVGMSFGERLDKLMSTVGLRNTELARIAKLDPSYISRIRNGERTPIDRDTLATSCASLAAHRCVYNDEISRLSPLIKETAEMVEEVDRGLDFESMLADDIKDWLLGDELSDSDITEMKRLFGWLEAFDFAESCARLGRFVEMEAPDLTPQASLRYGIDDMRKTELEFLDIAAYTQSPVVSMTSDMPMLEMVLDTEFSEAHSRALGRIVQRGGRINVIHVVERPLAEVLVSLRHWIPLYLSGRVTPYYLRGMRSRLFCHVNCVCDSCAMASEAVIGHQEEGRYYLSLLPEDIAYYQRKMDLVLEKATSIFEVYLSHREGDFARFEEDDRARQGNEGKREICAGEYENVRIMMYPGDCAVVSLVGEPAAHLVIRHPKLRYAISLMN